MISVVDNFLPEKEFIELQEYCNTNEFQIISPPGITLSVLEIPGHLYKYLEVDGYEIILSLIRSAYKGFNDNMNIHADNIIQESKTSIATVLYINDEEGVTDNGTAFWKHNTYGYSIPLDCSPEDFNNMIDVDAKDLSKWVMKDYISSRPNRILMYDADYFHSKYPAEITDGIRKILVTFYKKI